MAGWNSASPLRAARAWLSCLATSPKGRLVPWVLLLLVLLAGVRFYPRPPILADQAWSRSVLASGGELLRLTLAADQQYRLWTPLDQISPRLVEAVRLYGIDSRTLTGKLAQIGAALWLELRYGKAATLEAYLNLVPYGGNIEGVGAASLIYFRKPAARLTLPEALALAVIPQNPNRRLLGGAANAELKSARSRMWHLWLADHPADTKLAADQRLILQGLPRSSLPFLAPHATDLLLRQSAPLAEGLPQPIRSSVDLRLQRTLERVMAGYLRSRSDSGIRNASAMLVDVQDMTVKALIGSADYFDPGIDGQVNGTLAKRSPGSTLKPFIYGLALDQGLIHPMTMLKDAPTSFGPYSPENFDGRFAGPVSAQDALIRSRNIPAVGLAARLDSPDLYGFLQMAGVSGLATREHYGLALVLGGGEVTMEELAQLYATLANGGLWRPLAYRTDTAELSRPTRLLSEEAAFIVLDMLRRTPRPDTELPARPAIAWKTGTSWSFRDAWTAGVFGRYVLVVWLGNFDGVGNPALIGVEAAAPLYLRMVDALRAERLDPGELAFRQPAALRQVEACTDSGDLADGLCDTVTNTWFIAGKSPIKRSNLHRVVWVDRRTGRVTCTPGPDSEQRVYAYWPSDLKALFRRAGLPRREPLPLPDCAQDEETDAPHIASPLRSVTYSIRMAKPQGVMLRAEAASGVNTLYWFVDNSLVGHTAPGETLLWKPPAPRRYAVRVVDDGGRADARDLVVEFVP